MLRLRFYKLLWKVTKNRKWLLAFIDEMNKQIKDDIIRWRNENGNES